MVAIQCYEDTNSIVVCCAEYEWRSTFCQCDQQVVGVCDAVRIGYDGRNIVQGNLSQLLAIAFAVANDHEATIDKQVATVVCNF